MPPAALVLRGIWLRLMVRKLRRGRYTEAHVYKGAAMNVQIAKWGNSLAVRIPTNLIRSMGNKEGDQVKVSTTVDGGMSIRAANWNRKAFASEFAKVRSSMPMGQSVMNEVRNDPHY